MAIISGGSVPGGTVGAVGQKVRKMDAKTRFTILQAAKALGKPEKEIKRLLKRHPAFQKDGAVIREEIEGTNIKVTKILGSALNDFQAAPDVARKQRTAPAGTKRYIVHLNADQQAAVARGESISLGADAFAQGSKRYDPAKAKERRELRKARKAAAKTAQTAPATAEVTQPEAPDLEAELTQ